MDSFELLGEFVERNVEDAVAARVAGDPTQIVGAIGGDLNAIGETLIAGASAEAGWSILQIAGWTEAPSRGLSG